MASAQQKHRCPSCGQKGKKVSTTTLRAMLTKDVQCRLRAGGGFLFCTTQTCHVSYYRSDSSGEVFEGTNVRVPIFQKESAPDRLVCYCFEHRVDEIQDDVERTGHSIVPNDVASKCKRGLDRCEELNPQGTCCLGNVLMVVKQAQQKLEAPSTDAGPSPKALHDCCGAAKAAEPGGRS